MEELSRQFKAGEIDEKQLKEAARDMVKGYGKDIGIDYEVVYLDESTMPKDAKEVQVQPIYQMKKIEKY